MKNRTFLAILLGAAAFSWVMVSPCAAQVFLTGYVYRPGASGAERSPARTPGSGGQFVKLNGPVNVGAAPAGQTIVVQTSEAKTIGSPPLYVLAFVNVTGGIEGGLSVFADATGTFPLSVEVTVPNVGNPRISVDAFYFPAGGSCSSGGVCPAGARVDEFSGTSGTLIDDAFVTVFVPPASAAESARLTGTANREGRVDVTGSGVRVNALQRTATGGFFDRWVASAAGTIGADRHDLSAGKQSSVFALAVYRSSCPTGYYWNSSPTISRCSMIPVCPGEEHWNSNTKACGATPKCPEVEAALMHCFAP